MPRKNKNAREPYKPRKIRIKPSVRILPPKYDGIGPGRIVAAGEWVEMEQEDTQ